MGTFRTIYNKLHDIHARILVWMLGISVGTYILFLLLVDATLPFAFYAFPVAWGLYVGPKDKKTFLWSIAKVFTGITVCWFVFTWGETYYADPASDFHHIFHPKVPFYEPETELPRYIRFGLITMFASLLFMSPVLFATGLVATVSLIFPLPAIILIAMWGAFSLAAGPVGATLYPDIIRNIFGIVVILRNIFLMGVLMYLYEFMNCTTGKVGNLLGKGVVLSDELNTFEEVLEDLEKLVEKNIYVEELLDLVEALKERNIKAFYNADITLIGKPCRVGALYVLERFEEETKNVQQIHQSS